MPPKSNKKRRTKKAVLEALEKSLGVVSQACKIVGINRSTFYRYYNTDEKFKNQVDEMQEVALDFAESQLFQQMKKGSAASTIFYLKTKGKERGYYEKAEIGFTPGSIPENITVNVLGSDTEAVKSEDDIDENPKRRH